MFLHTQQKLLHKHIHACWARWNSWTVLMKSSGERHIHSSFFNRTQQLHLSPAHPHLPIRHVPIFQCHLVFLWISFTQCIPPFFLVLQISFCCGSTWVLCSAVRLSFSVPQILNRNKYSKPPLLLCVFVCYKCNINKIWILFKSGMQLQHIMMFRWSYFGGDPDPDCWSIFGRRCTTQNSDQRILTKFTVQFHYLQRFKLFHIGCFLMDTAQNVLTDFEKMFSTASVCYQVPVIWFWWWSRYWYLSIPKQPLR